MNPLISKGAARCLLPVAALLGATAACGASPEPADFDLTPWRLSARVQVLAQTERFRVQPLGNVTLIEQQDGVVVVDAGGTPQAGREVVAAVRALGAKPVKAVVITHWHGDHVLGLGEILQAFAGARVIATQATHQDMAAGLAAYADREKLGAGLARVRSAYQRQSENPALSSAERQGFAQAAAEVGQYTAQFEGAGWVPPGEHVERRLDLPDPRSPVEVHHLGEGNTPGDLVVWLPVERILVTGDLLVRPIPFAFDVHPRRWAQVLRTLAGWPADLVVPGHGAPGPLRPEMARIAGWLCEADARARRLDRSARPPAGPDLQDQAEALAGGDAWLRRWATAYWAVPLAASALRHRDSAGPDCPAAALP